MKRNNLVMLILILAFASCSFTTKIDSDPDKDKLLVHVITLALERLHFEPKALNDDFSEQVYNDYIEQLDPLKRYFLKSDIKEFDKYKTKIDDQLKSYDITFFTITYNRLMQRIDETKTIYKDILSEPFDYTTNETFSADYEQLDYVKNEKQLKERWKQQLKFSTISTYDDLISEQNGEKKKEDSIDDSSFEESEDTVAVSEEKIEKKSLTQLEIDARAETLKSLDIYYSDFIDDLEEKDWFSTYVNVIVEEFDPHTTYFAPSDKDKFDQQMSGKLEGIGARLSKRMDNVKIVELISGGPAWRGEELEVGDIIQKVRQEKEKESVSIVGMRLDDAIKLIKGPKGTKVILTVKKVDGSTEDITITRDIVELEETYAKSSMVLKNEKKYGIINLPKFYIDFDDYKNRNAASDVKQEIERLKGQGMEGLVLDLRNNGGGSLKTVVDIAGLFIEEGPVVQVRSTGEPKEVLEDEDKAIIWDGPLVIMVNELSASASEILAAAMQDYKRAIIIGSKQTYGKGTVQNVLDLNRMVRSNDTDLGALKLTTQKFYRINGGSTQLEGVKSDIIVPGRYSYIDVGEKDQENPLPWDKIDAVSYAKWDNYFDYNKTIENSKIRMNNNPMIKLIEKNGEWLKKQMDNKTFSLNYNTYKNKLELNEEQSKQFDAISDYKTDLSFSSLPYEVRLFETDTVLKEKRDRWHKALSKDIYMEEALNVLDDLKMTASIKNIATIKD